PRGQRGDEAEEPALDPAERDLRPRDERREREREERERREPPRAREVAAARDPVDEDGSEADDARRGALPRDPERLLAARAAEQPAAGVEGACDLHRLARMEREVLRGRKRERRP